MDLGAAAERSSAASWLSVRQGSCARSAGLFDPFGSPAGQGPDGHGLAPDPALQDPSGCAVHDEVVRVHGPGNHRLTEARAGVDDRLMPFSGDGVRREEHPGDGGVTIR